MKGGRGFIMVEVAVECVDKVPVVVEFLFAETEGVNGEV